MIPIDFVVEWRERAPWVENAQVEQDLILCRALVDIFRCTEITGQVAFRGGSALYKLHLPAARYSEDIDLVQVADGPIGPTIDALRSMVGPWLGEPKRTFTHGRVTLTFRILSEDSPPRRLRLKVEINSREHFSLLGLEHRPFAVASRWFSGSASIVTYSLDELLATKLRALYQRRKGRDLFDLWWAANHAAVDAGRVVECCREYLALEGQHVSREQFEANLAAKVRDADFAADLEPLLVAGAAWDIAAAATYVRQELLRRLPRQA